MDGFTTGEAARLLASARSYEDGLRQRTEGITQMVWGATTSAMFVTYGFAAVIAATDLAFSLLWLPWVSLGSVITYALWRSAALAAPERIGNLTRPILRILLVTAAVSAVFAVAQPDGPTLSLGLTGAAWVAIGAVNVFGASQRGRLLWSTCGLVMLGCAAAVAALGAPIEEAGFVSMVVPALVATATGLWQTVSS